MVEFEDDLMIGALTGGFWYLVATASSPGSIPPPLPPASSLDAGPPGGNVDVMNGPKSDQITKMLSSALQ